MENERCELSKSTESQEMYLKTIYRLGIRNGSVCVTDIAEELNYAKASVSKAIKHLRLTGQVKDTGKREIELTEKGKEAAKYLCERYEFYRKKLEQNGVSAERAHEAACRMEHVIPNDVYETLKENTKQR